MEYLLIFIYAIFVNNVVLAQFLGICPFLGVSKKVDTALGMSAAVAFVLTLATIVTFLIQHYVLNVFDLQYLQTITFILVIAALVQMVEIILKKVSPALYQALGDEMLSGNDEKYRERLYADFNSRNDTISHDPYYKYAADYNEILMHFPANVIAGLTPAKTAAITR